MFAIKVLMVSLLVAVVVTLCTSVTMRHYRRRFESQERRAAIVIGVSSALFLPAMYLSENLLPGRVGEMTATGLMIMICVAAVGTVWRILTARNA